MQYPAATAWTLLLTSMLQVLSFLPAAFSSSGASAAAQGLHYHPGNSGLRAPTISDMSSHASAAPWPAEQRLQASSSATLPTQQTTDIDPGQQSSMSVLDNQDPVVLGIGSGKSAAAEETIPNSRIAGPGTNPVLILPTTVATAIRFDENVARSILSASGMVGRKSRVLHTHSIVPTLINSSGKLEQTSRRKKLMHVVVRPRNTPVPPSGPSHKIHSVQD